MFITASKEHKLGPDDAEFVDVIHTDCLARGILAASGHADFYANGGLYQPGCVPTQDQSSFLCAFFSVLVHFVDTVKMLNANVTKRFHVVCVMFL